MKLICALIGHAFPVLDGEALRRFIRGDVTEMHRTCRRCGFVQTWTIDR